MSAECEVMDMRPSSPKLACSEKCSGLASEESNMKEQLLRSSPSVVVVSYGTIIKLGMHCSVYTQSS